MNRKLKHVVLAAALAACAESDINGTAGGAAFDVASGEGTPGAVYTLTNQTTGNAVAVFHRAVDGTLEFAGLAPTGGTGTGGGLSSEGSLVLSENERWLFAVNAGSHELSIFAVNASGLSLVQRIGSNGVRPVSIATRGRLVYVLNAGGEGNIAGFTQDQSGRLTPIPGSTRSLSAADAGGAQVSFTPDGSALVVTERLTNVIDVFTLDRNGLASNAHIHPSAGLTPFGFAFNQHGVLIVSEAFGGAADASAASSYLVGAQGALTPLTGSLETTETSACWTVTSKDGRFAYVANTGSSTVTGYAVDSSGALTRIDADGVTGDLGQSAGAADMALSRDGRFLFVLANGVGGIASFRQNKSGSLERITITGGLPAGTVGLAAR